MNFERGGFFCQRMLRYGFYTACTVPLPLLRSVAPAEDLRAPKHQYRGREMLPLRGSVPPAEDLRAPRRKHQYCGREMLPLRGSVASVRVDPRSVRNETRSDEVLRGWCSSGPGFGCRFRHTVPSSDPLLHGRLGKLLKFSSVGCGFQARSCLLRSWRGCRRCARQQPIGRQCSAGLRGLRPRGRRSMCQVRVGQQCEGHFSRGACWLRQG